MAPTDHAGIRTPPCIRTHFPWSAFFQLSDPHLLAEGLCFVSGCQKPTGAGCGTGETGLGQPQSIRPDLLRSAATSVKNGEGFGVTASCANSLGPSGIPLALLCPAKPWTTLALLSPGLQPGEASLVCRLFLAPAGLPLAAGALIPALSITQRGQPPAPEPSMGPARIGWDCQLAWRIDAPSLGGPSNHPPVADRQAPGLDLPSPCKQPEAVFY